MPRDIYTTVDDCNSLNINHLKSLYNKYNGPVWVYDASVIIDRIKKLRKFDTIRFAQKSCSNIHILRLMGEYGVKVDAVSLGEIERALLAGFRCGENSDDIVFSADLLEQSTLKKILESKILVNIGSIDMLHQLGNSHGHRVWLRINPGFGDGHSKKTNTGGKNSKHGIWYKDIPLALSCVHHYGFQLLGFHMHIGSGVNYKFLSEVCDVMVDQVFSSGEDLIVISAGGGMEISYHDNNSSSVLDVDHYFNLWNTARNRISDHLGHAVRLEIEPGRFLVAESGMLIAQVRAVKDIEDHHFVLVDVGFNDLMRPILYGSYHHISLIPAEDNRNIFMEPVYDTIVGGPICESGDLFTQTSDGDLISRSLPYAKVGDYLVFHDTGAYGASMSSNYNSRLLLPEVLFKSGNAYQIRRRQTLKELFSLEL